MSRLRMLAVLFAVAVRILTAGRAIAAEAAMPEAGMGIELPAGVTQRNLAVGSAAPLLPVGAIVELARFTFARGRSLSSP